MERVDHYCANPGHQVGGLGDALTVHDQRWAYCPGGYEAEHRWLSTGGMTFGQLKRLLAYSIIEAARP